MEVLDKINKLREENGWSMYKLAYESMLTPSTLSNMFYRKTQPTIDTLKSICTAFGITLSEFFAEENKMLSAQEKEILSYYKKLSKKNQLAVLNLLKNL